MIDPSDFEIEVAEVRLYRGGKQIGAFSLALREALAFGFSLGKPSALCSQIPDRGVNVVVRPVLREFAHQDVQALRVHRVHRRGCRRLD